MVVPVERQLWLCGCQIGFGIMRHTGNQHMAGTGRNIFPVILFQGDPIRKILCLLLLNEHFKWVWLNGVACGVTISGIHKL